MPLERWETEASYFTNSNHNKRKFKQCNLGWKTAIKTSLNNFSHCFCHYSQKDDSVRLTFHLQWAPTVAENTVHLHLVIKLKHAQNERDPSMHNTFNIRNDWNHILSIWPRLWLIATFPISARQKAAVTLLQPCYKNIKQGVESIGCGVMI